MPSKAMKVRFSNDAKKEKKEYPGRHNVTLSQAGQEAYEAVEKRLPALNQSEILELAVLVLKDAPPASIRKIVETRDTIVEAREKEAKKAGKHQETPAAAGTGAEVVA